MDNPLGHFAHEYENPGSPLLTRVAAPSGLEILYSYQDVLGDRRLAAITNLVNSAVLSASGYKYDQADRIREWTVWQAILPATAMTVAHDKLDRLTSVISRNAGTGALIQDYAYSYDPVGNRLTEKIGSSLVKATHNDLKQISTINRGSAVEFVEFGGSVNEPANVKVNNQAALALSNNLFSAAVTNLAQGSNTVTITATDVIHRHRNESAFNPVTDDRQRHEQLGILARNLGVRARVRSPRIGGRIAPVLGRHGQTIAHGIRVLSSCQLEVPSECGCRATGERRQEPAHGEARLTPLLPWWSPSGRSTGACTA